MKRDTLSPTRTKRTRLKLTTRETSTVKGRNVATALVSYNPNRIAQSFKVLRVS